MQSLTFISVVFFFFICPANLKAEPAQIAPDSIIELADGAVQGSVELVNSLLQKKKQLEICLTAGRLDALINQVIKATSKKGENFNDQRKDKGREPLFSANERLTSFTGYCSELSGQIVAGYRFMPKLKSSEHKRAKDYAKSIYEELKTYRKSLKGP